MILFGATGFTGKLAAVYLARNYKNVKWALAGRSYTKLKDIKEKLVKINSELRSLEIIIADSNNIEELEKLAV